VADCWKTIGYFFKHFVGDAARLAKLRRELQECHLWWVIVIQVQVFDQTLLWWNNLST
jgi:hypothetical protein